MTSTSFVRMFGVALLVAAGCGSNSPAGVSGTAGHGGHRRRRNDHERQRRDVGQRYGGDHGERRDRRRAAAAGTTASGSGGTTGSGTGGGTGSGGTGGIKVGNPQCSDGIDNDGDGKIDYDDPECVGPLDNDESSFATGIPGDNMDACKQDCFFDGNSGAGDDGCNWQLKCDPQSVEPKCPYDQQYATQHANECSVSASQSQTCVDKCRKLVPNGCDCFGCCLIPGAPNADPARRDLHGRRLRQPGEVPALHAGDPVLEPVRPLRDLHRQADAARRLHHHDAGRRAPTARRRRPTTAAATSCPAVRARRRRRTAAGRTTAASPAAASRPASSRDSKTSLRPIQRLRAGAHSASAAAG